jgi:asparagine synthase (glutamine-hydrolysing)
MCGFAGWFDPGPPSLDVLKTMTTKLVHRGPDADGYFFKGPVALGHRRLSVLDLTGSVQPMTKQGQTLVYNGELYNYQELKKELVALGFTLTTSGDTEVVLTALIAWKQEAVKKFRGMFAFAFWDPLEGCLILARDHFGIKPLHYFYDGEKLVFASELKALLVHPSICTQIDHNALALFLEAQYIPAPYTIYQEIHKLLPGHILTLKKGCIKIEPYWALSYEPKICITEDEALQILDQKLQSSVNSMRVADVPCGVFLSGGLDSSLLAALMGPRSDFFTIGFKDNSTHSEHLYAQKVAQHVRAHHHCLMVGPCDILSRLDKWTDYFDEPFGDQAAFPTLLLSEFASKNVKVILSGEGADEVFGGYSNYAKRLKEAPLVHKLSFISKIYPYLPLKLRTERVLKAASRPLSCRYTGISKLFDCEARSQIFSQQFLATSETCLQHLAADHYKGCDSNSYLDKMLHIDQKLWLTDNLLTKVDRASMAYSLEARVPYLDHPLVEWVAKLPQELKINKGSCKYLLKKLALKYLPPESVYRSKQGLSMPLHQWLLADLKPRLQQLHSLSNRNIFNKNYLQTLIQDSSGRQSTRIFTLLMLELWFERYKPDFKV